MNSSKIKLFAATLASLALIALSYAQFTVQHNTGTNVETYITGDTSDAGGGPYNGVATLPASALYCAFVNGDRADIRAYVDTTYAVGSYYIGYFPGGADFYLSITN